MSLKTEPAEESRKLFLNYPKNIYQCVLKFYQEFYFRAILINKGKYLKNISMVQIRKYLYTQTIA